MSTTSTGVVSDVFGRMLSASQIEEAVITALQTWYPTYLREQERQMNLPSSTFLAPRNYTGRNKFEMEAPEELPKVVVIAPGTVGAPTKVGGGMYSATWRVGIGIAVGAETEEDSNRAVKAFGAATRAIMLQSSGLDAVGAIDIAWTDEAYDDLPVPNPVQLVKAASLYFNVEIVDVVTRGGGPLTPDQDPASYTLGEIQTADAELDVVEEITPTS